MTPEFSRPVRIDTIGAGARDISIEAGESERAALAERFGLVAIDRLTAELSVDRKGEEIEARGRLSAAVVQSCVASGAPVPEEIDEPFMIRFRPPPAEPSGEEEIELAEEEMDVVFYDGASIDIGEAVAETLSLSLDPYPRAPEAETVLREAGVLSEEEAKPEGALAGLKDLLSGGKS